MDIEEVEEEDVTNRKQKKTNVKSPLGIFNLSSAHLSPEKENILNKGLKYAPKVGLNKFQTLMDIQKYTRQISIKKHFMQNPIMRQ